MIKKLFITIAVLMVLFLITASLQSDQFSVTRSTSISADPSTVFPQVNNLHQWEKWSPWEKMDPTATKTYEGPESGVGASFHWAGNSEVGEGKMTITESRPNELIKFRLDFIKPFAGTDTAEFLFKSEDNQTKVIWSMYGEKNFIAKAIGLIIDCDKMVGEQFEKGLKDLKNLVELSSRDNNSKATK